MPFTRQETFLAGTAAGGCYHCRRHLRPGDTVVDTGIDIDFEGRLRFCGTCVTEMGHLIGMITPDKVAPLEGAVAEALRRAVDAEHAAKEAEALANQLLAYAQPRGEFPSADESVPGESPVQPAQPTVEAPARTNPKRKTGAAA